jgi:hypothetical protein
MLFAKHFSKRGIRTKKRRKRTKKKCRKQQVGREKEKKENGKLQPLTPADAQKAKGIRGEIFFFGSFVDFSSRSLTVAGETLVACVKFGVDSGSMLLFDL